MRERGGRREREGERDGDTGHEQRETETDRLTERRTDGQTERLVNRFKNCAIYENANGNVDTEKGPQTEKLALLLIRIMKYGNVQFLLHK